MDAPITIKNSPIFTAKTLKQILLLKHIHFNSIVFWDLDNTVFQTQQELGSDQWISNLIDITKVQLGSSFDIALIKALYNTIQHHVKIMEVEEDTIRVIRYLNQIGIQQRFITARHPSLVSITMQHLESLDPSIKQWLSPNKILFCDAQHRGRTLFKSTPLSPSDHLVMIDDKFQNISGVKAIADRLGLSFTGFHYTFLADKVASFNMHRANFQLLAIKQLLPEHIQRFIAQLKLVVEVQPHLAIHEEASVDSQNQKTRAF